ncbi:MAG TPA: DNA mismatch repair endonuclease MutL, partial [bacterium]|nr:DNA mismatch repair endonuclease MutL [bacterium]
MNKIKVLPEIIANKIAAGEVVERPASVVKELVENAIDGGASRVTVEIKGGGISMIRVSDDGCGMSRDDAVMSLERHATSKIGDVDDIYVIRSLGFRGEALPSIASVSRFELASCEGGNVPGTKISVDGGKVGEIREAGMSKGTVVTVQDLFFNVPARRKFLKTHQTETGHILNVVTLSALAHTAVA